MMNARLWCVGLIGSLLVGCTAATPIEGAPAPILLHAGEDTATVGTYARNTLQIREDIIASFRGDALVSEDSARMSVSLRVGDAYYPLDGTNAIPLAERLEVGAELQLVVADEDHVVAEIPLVIGAPELPADTIAGPGCWYDIYTVEFWQDCGSCFWVRRLIEFRHFLFEHCPNSARVGAQLPSTWTCRAC